MKNMSQSLRDLDKVRTLSVAEATAIAPHPSIPRLQQLQRSGNNVKTPPLLLPIPQGQTGRKDKKHFSSSLQPRTPDEASAALLAFIDSGQCLPGIVAKPAASAAQAMRGANPPEPASSEPLIGFNAAGIKFDTGGAKPETALAGGSVLGGGAPGHLQLPPSQGDAQHNGPALSHVDLNSQTVGALPKRVALDPVTNELRSYTTLMDQFSLHNFIIWNGKALRNTPEFMSYQRTYADSWSGILGIISQLEKFLIQANVKMAVINGQRVASLARLNAPHTSKYELMSCVANEDQVRTQMLRVDFGNEADKLRAIVLVQTLARRLIARRSVNTLRKRNYAAIFIQCCARIFVSRRRIARLAKQAQENTNRIWGENQSRMLDVYGAMRPGRTRLVVVLPAFSAQEYIRLQIDEFEYQQNVHVSCFQQLLNPDVTLLYISPVMLNAQIVAYHERLLSLLGLPEGSVVRRLRIFVPEMSLRLPTHTPVAQALWYSSECLRKIKALAKHFDYFVFLPTAGMSYVEKRIANFLGAMTLSPDPTLASALTSRSNAKRAFIEAGLNVPIGAHDIFDEDDLFVALSKLLSCNLDINRWFIRLNNDFNGNSLCILDCSKMHVVTSLREEQIVIVNTSGNFMAWFEHRVQLNARKRLATAFQRSEMEMFDVIRKDLYSSWAEYMKHVKREGCVIEAEPPSTLGLLDCSCLVEPVRNNVASANRSADKDETGTSEPHKDIDVAESNHNDGVPSNAGPLGVSVKLLDPRFVLSDDFGQVQASLSSLPPGIPNSALKGAMTALCKLLWNKIQCIGFVTARFLISWDQKDGIPRLLATELSFGLSEHISATCTHGALIARMVHLNSLDPAKSKLSTLGAAPGADAVTSDPLAPGTNFINFARTGSAGNAQTFSTPVPVWTPPLFNSLDGCYLYIPMMYHAPLRSCRNDMFFKICKMHNVVFDVTKRSGVLFFMVDSVSTGVLSLLVLHGNHISQQAGASVEDLKGNQENSRAVMRIALLDLAVSTLSFIVRNFGRDSDLAPSRPIKEASRGPRGAGNLGDNVADATFGVGLEDVQAARNHWSLSSIHSRLRRQLRREQKMLDKKK